MTLKIAHTLWNHKNDGELLEMCAIYGLLQSVRRTCVTYFVNARSRLSTPALWAKKLCLITKFNLMVSTGNIYQFEHDVFISLSMMYLSAWAWCTIREFLLWFQIEVIIFCLKKSEFDKAIWAQWFKFDNFTLLKNTETI